MKKYLLGVAAFGLISLGAALAVRADVKLPHVIGSHMVLQQQRPVVIWGWADPGEAVTVTVDQQSAQCTADDKGNWKVSLPAMEADGKTHCATVSGKNKIELDDILVGEVWLGSGQSNMEWPVGATTKPQEAIAAANHPQIRLFQIPKVETLQPASDVNAEWKPCTPQAAGGFSAALYFFGLRLHKDLNVPVGLINDSWGGSPIEAWIVAGQKSGRMYNGMTAPVTSFAIRGAIWYQGESNVPGGLAYFGQMKALIEGWRKAWGNEFPFYFVQLAPWSGGYQAGALPPLWEAQVESLKIPGTGMAVVTDLVDDLKDIHPKNKLDVGNRLALWALAKTYKKDLVYSGPLYQSMAVEGNKVRLSFAHVGGGLKSRDGKPLAEFQIAAADGKFVPAEAAIDGNTVVVQGKDVAAPTQVRFGWHNTANPNLMNAEGLPASPFQTNNWHGGTGQ